MTVREFCKRRTNANELCTITEGGWIVASVWIDCEDLFAMNDRLAKREVISDKWTTLPIVTEHGDTIVIPCHEINT